MASSTTPPPTEATSYTKMLIGDVEDVGAHCDFCRQIDFLPFRCESCKGTFCLEHRTETTHKCVNAGAWARARAGLDNTTTATTPRKPTTSSTKKCAKSHCGNEISSLKPGSSCTECDQWYCWAHRMREDHDCFKLAPRVARPTSVLQQQREKGLAALERIRSWKLVKNVSASTSDSKLSRTPSSNSSILSTSKFSFRPKSAATSSVAERNRLKANAKGDTAAVPPERRIYVHVRADNLSPSAKPSEDDFFYDQKWTVGRMLDAAAKSLHVENVNNRVGEDQKLRVWRKIGKKESVDAWQLLEFSKKLEEAGVVTGDELRLCRGTDPPRPDLGHA